MIRASFFWVGYFIFSINEKRAKGTTGLPSFRDRFRALWFDVKQESPLLARSAPGLGSQTPEKWEHQHPNALKVKYRQTQY